MTKKMHYQITIFGVCSPYSKINILNSSSISQGKKDDMSSKFGPWLLLILLLCYYSLSIITLGLTFCCRPWQPKLYASIPIFCLFHRPWIPIILGSHFTSSNRLISIFFPPSEFIVRNVENWVGTQYNECKSDYMSLMHITLNSMAYGTRRFNSAFTGALQ